MSRILLYAMWECAERLWEPCWPAFPANYSSREGPLRSISGAEPGASTSPGFQQLLWAHRTESHGDSSPRAGRATRGLSPASQQGHWAPRGDPGLVEQQQGPHSRNPLLQTLPKAPGSSKEEEPHPHQRRTQTQAGELPWEIQGEEVTSRGVSTPLGLCNLLAVEMRHHRAPKVSLGWRWPLSLPWEKEPLSCCGDRARMQLDTASRALLCCKIWLPFSHL